MNVKFIVLSTNGIYGHYGYGVTQEEAVKNMNKAAKKKIGKDKIKVCRFTSELPFAPQNRDATEQEADAWLGQDGTVNWIRCEREWIAKADKHGVK